MSAIANELGVSAQALYWHFPSKEALLHAFLLRTLQRTVTVFIEATEAEGSASAKLAALVRAHVHLELEGADGESFGSWYSASLLSVKLPDDVEREFRRLNRASLQIYRDVLSTGHESGEFREIDVLTTAFAISSMCTAVATWAKPSVSRTGMIADRFVDLALAMVSARKTARRQPSPRS